MNVTPLVAAVRVNPFDTAAREVLSDWCEERGFLAPAAALRSARPESLEYVRALSALSYLFGDEGASGGTAGRYTHVVGFDSMDDVGPREQCEIAMTCTRAFRLRRILLTSPDLKMTRGGFMDVVRVRLGTVELLDASDESPIPGSLFDEGGPELFDTHVPVALRLHVTVFNPMRFSIDLRACALGVDVPRARCAKCSREEEAVARAAAYPDGPVRELPWGWFIAKDNNLYCERCALEKGVNLP